MFSQDSVQTGAAQGLSDVHAPGFDLAEGGERGMWRRREGSLLGSSERQTLSSPPFFPHLRAMPVDV